MANNLITPSMIAKQATLEFKNHMVMLDKISRTYQSEYERKIGETVSIRKPVMYQVIEGADITGQVQDTVEGTVSLTLNKQRVVPISFSSAELALDIEDFSERYIRPAIIALVQEIESDIAAEYTKVWNFYGSSEGITVGALAQAGARLTMLSVPKYDRYAFLNPMASAELAAQLKTVFPTDIATKAIEMAVVGKAGGFEIFETSSLENHTVGNYGGTPLVNGAGQVLTWDAAKNTFSQTLNTDGWDPSVTGLLNEGDVFTIAGVYSVNPRTKQSTGFLQTFTVRSTANSNGSGEAALTVSPAMVTSGAHQNVSGAPADNAAITVVSGAANSVHQVNFLFHKDAIALVFAKLGKPAGAATYGQESMDNINIRMIGDYDVMTDKSIYRFDVLYGLETVAPMAAIRLEDQSA